MFSCNFNRQVTCEGIVYSNGLTYKNSKLFSGSCITHHSNLKIRSVQSYKNGKDHGDWVFYFDNGIIETKGQFSEGVKKGIWEYYNSKGQLRLTVQYNDVGEIINSNKTTFY